LRRSFASTLLESGAGLHDASAFLGHANITTTSRYLATTGVRKQAVLGRFEAARQAHETAEASSADVSSLGALPFAGAGADAAAHRAPSPR